MWKAWCQRLPPCEMSGPMPGSVTSTIASVRTASGCAAASANATGPPQSWPTRCQRAMAERRRRATARDRRRPSSCRSRRAVASCRRGRAGRATISRWRGASSGMTRRHSYQVDGQPCSRTTGSPAPALDVVERHVGESRVMVLDVHRLRVGLDARSRRQKRHRISRSAPRPRVAGGAPLPPQARQSVALNRPSGSKLRPMSSFPAMNNDCTAPNEGCRTPTSTIQASGTPSPSRLRWNATEHGCGAPRPASGSCCERERGQRARRLADVPFDRMEAIAAVRDVRRADVLGGGDQVGDAARARARRAESGTGACGSSTPTSSAPARWMSIGYQPTPTESAKCAARGPGW